MPDPYLDALNKVDAIVAHARFDLGFVAHPVATIYLIGQLEFELASGGVVQWLTNRSGRYAAETATALVEIGAIKCARIVREIVAIAPSAASLPDDAARADAVRRASGATHNEWRRLADELLEWPEDIDGLLRAYVESHVASLL
jgi:hypothetical protein